MRPGPDVVVRLAAPAKLTVSLRVVGRRPDGYHLLDAEMVSVDLCDTLEVEETPALRASRLQVVDEVVGGSGIGDVPSGGANLVLRALDAVDRRASVRLVKRIPPGSGLGGGSSDAGAVLRWAGCSDLALAARLGADVPFCVTGGRARVRGIGELVQPLDPADARYLVLLPPLSVSTPAAYAAFDELEREQRRRSTSVNDLEAAALRVEPALARWRDAFAAVVGRRPSLAGSGSAWFVEVHTEEHAEGGARGGDRLGAPGEVVVDGRAAPVLDLRTVGPDAGPGT